MRADDLKIIAEGEPVLIERHDGWYVEVVACGGVASAGPTTKATAEAIFKEVQDAVKLSAN